MLVTQRDCAELPMSAAINVSPLHLSSIIALRSVSLPSRLNAYRTAVVLGSTDNGGPAR